ncbi:hypothetical protein KEM55_005255 [Ascosphaera atra]|nr:hypothetical protein KEM55_005255 [Ascosphaera atra]
MTSLGEKTSSKEPEVHDVSASEDGDSLIAPTEEEQAILRKVPGPISGTGYWLCIVEFAERASYYGCKQVFSNFIQFPLPKGGNGAGAPPRNSETNAGALGKGLQTSSALTTLFTFLAYAIPILGGYVADTHLGRYKTICLGILICGIAHIIMVFGALPSVLQAGNGLPPFIISLLVLAFGSGEYMTLALYSLSFVNELWSNWD